MGITIAEHIKTLESYGKGRKGFTGQPIDFQASINFAIDTMHKYQRIQAIINYAKDSDGAVKYNWLYEQIGEVLEDGSTN